MALTVIHDEEAHRFTVEVEGVPAVLDYRLQGTRTLFLHMGVPPALEGRGIGSALVRAGLSYAREQGCRIVPLCSFVAAYLRRHPEYGR